MIVVCIDDDFRIGKDKIKTPDKTPVMGQLYEVTKVRYKMIDGGKRMFYILKEFRANQWWHHSFFREVDVNIDELKEVLENIESNTIDA